MGNDTFDAILHYGNENVPVPVPGTAFPERAMPLRSTFLVTMVGRRGGCSCSISVPDVSCKQFLK